MLKYLAQAPAKFFNFSQAAKKPGSPAQQEVLRGLADQAKTPNFAGANRQFEITANYCAKTTAAARLALIESLQEQAPLSELLSAARRLGEANAYLADSLEDMAAQKRSCEETEHSLSGIFTKANTHTCRSMGGQIRALATYAQHNQGQTDFLFESLGRYLTQEAAQWIEQEFFTTNPKPQAKQEAPLLSMAT